MGFVKDTAIIEIGKARGAGHLYHFSQGENNRLVATYVDYYTKRGVVKESRDQGVTWTEVGDTGRTLQIATRKGQVTFTSGENRVGTYSAQQGNVTEDVTAKVKIGTSVVAPVPEQEAYMVSGAADPSRGSQGGFAFYRHSTGQVYGHTPGRGVSGFWGDEAGSSNMHIVWIFVDPFFEPINYQVLAKWNGNGWASYNQVPGDRYPTPMAFEQLVGGSGFEGWLNSRSATSGVSYRVGRPSPSFFLPADQWQGGTNAAPVWVPNLASLDSTNYRSILSVPNGLEADINITRGAIYGYVAGKITFGLLEPGFGFAWSQGFVDNVDYGGPALNAELETAPRQRKFLGVIDTGFSRARIWMPYSNGIFGMGVIAQLFGDQPDCQSLFWIYDKEPGRVPQSVKAQDGVYQDRTDVQKSKPVVSGSKYSRW